MKKKKYTKPKYKLEKVMTVPFDYFMKKKKYKVGCRQCSTCHACR